MTIRSDHKPYLSEPAPDHVYVEAKALAEAICGSLPTEDVIHKLISYRVRAAIAERYAERERCAQIAEKMLVFADTTSGADKAIAEAIRGRHERSSVVMSEHPQDVLATAEALLNGFLKWLKAGEAKGHLSGGAMYGLKDQIAAAIVAERERCARIAEGEAHRDCGVAEQIAAAIRGRP